MVTRNTADHDDDDQTMSAEEAASMYWKDADPSPERNDAEQVDRDDERQSER